MSQYWSALVHTLTPYVPGEQPKLPDLVKLNTNENPYPPSPRALAAMQAELGNDAARLRLYPDPNGDLLKHAVAEHFAEHGIEPAQVFVGNGSDEVLAHAFLALLKHASLMLGNSSAGIREAPVYGVPTVNVGTRQRNRFSAPSIINVAPSRDAILAALRDAAQRPRACASQHFGAGDSARQFLEVLRSDAFWRLPKQKSFFGAAGAQ